MLNEHLNDLNICDDFIVVGVSGMDSETFVVVLLVVVRSFFVNHSPHWYLYVMCLLEDFVLYASHCLTLLLVCVYLPFDNGLYLGHLNFKKHWISWKVLLTQDYDMLAVVGDFNVD